MSDLSGAFMAAIVPVVVLAAAGASLFVLAHRRERERLRLEKHQALRSFIVAAECVIAAADTSPEYRLVLRAAVVDARRELGPPWNGAAR